MKKGDMIWVEGERELFLNMQKTLDGTTKAAMQGLERAALNIVADAKRNLKDNGSVVTGQLRASGKVQMVDGKADVLEAGFFSQEGESGYAAAVEYGRRAGKMPPVDMLMEWLRKRTSKSKALRSAVIHMEGRRRTRKEAYTKDDLLRSAAWSLAKWIAKKGTKPHPFLTPAVEDNKTKVNDAIAMAVKQVIK
jgi:hypothetical protein